MLSTRLPKSYELRDYISTCLCHHETYIRNARCVKEYSGLKLLRKQ